MTAQGIEYNLPDHPTVPKNSEGSKERITYTGTARKMTIKM